MPPLLFKGVNKRRWDWPTASYLWLSAGECPAAPFFDFRVTVECEESVWHVEDNGSNLERLVAALAAGRQSPDKFDYVVIEERLVRSVGIAIKPTKGDSPDAEANAAWHRDLVQLTGTKLVALLHLIHDHGQFFRVSEKRVGELVLAGMGSGTLDGSRVNSKLVSYLAG